MIEGGRSRDVCWEGWHQAPIVLITVKLKKVGGTLDVLTS